LHDRLTYEDVKIIDPEFELHQFKDEMQHLVLGQQKASEKSNEITAILSLLKMLSPEGCVMVG
jgi:hypothetical protein